MDRVLLSLAVQVPVDGPGCEPIHTGLLAEPVSAITSLAFVAAGVHIAISGRRAGARLDRSVRHPGAAVRPDRPVRRRPSAVLGYAALVAGVGVGSFVQHGPDPWWSDVAHDLPLLATLAFVAADALSDLTGRARVWWWWAAPTAALLPLIVVAPRAGDLAQTGVAAAAVALTVARARARPSTRRRVVASLVLLTVGATIGTLSRAGGPLCVPESVWQGHAAWHVLASLALAVLAPAIGVRGGAVAPLGPAEPGRHG